MRKWFDTHAGSIGCTGCCLIALINLCLTFLPPLFAIINWDASYLWWWMGFVVEFVLSWAIGIVGIYISETEEEKEKGEK
jgi:hypothetical protein